MPSVSNLVSTEQTSEILQTNLSCSDRPARGTSIETTSTHITQVSDEANLSTSSCIATDSGVSSASSINRIQQELSHSNDVVYAGTQHSMTDETSVAHSEIITSSQSTPNYVIVQGFVTDFIMNGLEFSGLINEDSQDKAKDFQNKTDNNNVSDITVFDKDEIDDSDNRNNSSEWLRQESEKNKILIPTMKMT